MANRESDVVVPYRYSLTEDAVTLGPDCKDLFTDIIASFGDRGGRIRLGPGGFYFSGWPVWNKPVIVEGCGKADASGRGTIIWGADGVTPLIISSESSGSANGSAVRDLNIRKVANTAISYAATYAVASQSRVTSAAAVAALAVGRLIRIGGIGFRCPRPNVTASVSVGTNAVTYTHPTMGVDCGMLVGMWITIAGAYTQSVKIATNDGAGNLTVVNGDGTAANAAATVSSAQVTHVADAIARIVGFDGDDVIFDASNQVPSDADHTNTEITDGSCGIYARTVCSIENVSFGELGQPAHSFNGAGVYIYGNNDADAPWSNHANGVQLKNIDAYNCKCTVRVQGQDANAGLFEYVHGAPGSVTGWQFEEYSQHGNGWVKPQAQGGASFIDSWLSGAPIFVFDVYNEGGTACSFSPKTFWSGNAPDMCGGHKIAGGRFSDVITDDVGGGGANAPLCSLTIEPYGTDNNDGSYDRTKANLGWMREAGGTLDGLVWAFSQAAHSNPVGLFGLWARPNDNSWKRAALAVLGSVADAKLADGALDDLVAAFGLWLGHDLATGRIDLREAMHFFAGSVAQSAKARTLRLRTDVLPLGNLGWGSDGTNIFSQGAYEDHREQDKDCSAAGTITLTAAEMSTRALRLTGSPGAGYNVVMDTAAVLHATEHGVAAMPTLWAKWVTNASGQTATLKGASGDAGKAIATGETRMAINRNGVIQIGAALT